MIRPLIDAKSVTCPNALELKKFANGFLDDCGIDAVREHLATCERCSTISDSLTNSDDVVLEYFRRRSLASETKSIGADLSRSANSSSDCGEDVSSRIGTRIGPYEILGVLGRGGMGTVYRVRHERLKKEFALKLLSSKRLHRSLAREEFRREMTTLGQINHRGIVQATDAGEADGTMYLVMEHVQGLNLSQALTRLGVLSIDNACEIARQVAEALESASQRGLVHRDIKPKNLMLTPEGEIKLLDFGTATLNDESAPDAVDADENSVARLETECVVAARSREVVGTTHYMSPEQAKDPTLADVRSDIYSLGCTLFKLLTGRAPFADEQDGATSLSTRQEVMAAQVAKEPPKLQIEGDRQQRQRMQAIVTRCLQKLPDDRYQSPGELAADLAELANGSSLVKLAEAAGATDPERATNRPKPVRTSGRRVRQRIVLGIFGAAIFLGAALGAWFVLREGDPTQVHVVDDDSETLIRLGHVEGDWSITVAIDREDWLKGSAGIYYGSAPAEHRGQAAVLFEVIDIATPPEGFKGLQVRRRQFACRTGEPYLSQDSRTIGEETVPISKDQPHVLTIVAKDGELDFVAVDDFVCDRLFDRERDFNTQPIDVGGHVGLVSVRGYSIFKVTEPLE